MGGQVIVTTEENRPDLPKCPGCERRLLMDIAGESWLVCMNDRCTVVFFERKTVRILGAGEWPIRP